MNKLLMKDDVTCKCISFFCTVQYGREHSDKNITITCALKMWLYYKPPKRRKLHGNTCMLFK